MAVVYVTRKQRQRLDHLDRVNRRVFNAVGYLIFNIPNITPDEIDLAIAHGLRVVLYRETHRDEIFAQAARNIHDKTSAWGIGADIQEMMGDKPTERPPDNAPANTHYSTMTEAEKTESWLRAVKGYDQKLRRGPGGRTDTRLIG